MNTFSQMNYFSAMILFLVLIGLIGITIVFIMLEYYYKLTYAENKYLHKKTISYTLLCGVIIGRIGGAILGAIFDDIDRFLYHLIAYIFGILITIPSVVKYFRTR